MDEDQELKFVCKLCNKKYPCGKSLGGHMRSHVVANYAESEENFEANLKKFSFFSGGDGGGDFGNGQTSYGLRENPKKTWRAVDSTFPLPQEKICKQCGKGFQSLKALCGHMACHSERDKGLKDDHSWTSENQKMALDSYSDTEEGEEEPRLRTRSSSSKSKKFKKIVNTSSFSLANYNGGSSSISEVDVLDQEEVAICLMMLSKDVGNKGGVNSVVESSDNNSVVLETKSSSIDMRIGTKKVSLDHIYKNIEDVKLKGRAFDEETANSDSGYFLDECTKAESDVSVEGYRRNFALGEWNKIKNFRTEDEDFAEFESRKRTDNNSEKRSKYECFNCKKTFKSYQALGGHRPCHKRSNALYESRYESGENSPKESTQFKKVKPKKNKGHVCPFCDRVFKNGQALGGHKRSHFIGGHEGTSNQAVIKKPEVPDLLDLNLPAPEEDEDGQFFHW
ncbi:hypothetical protein ACJIZ3_019999 [Penstemon smallii]|uniref:C2H2-type domain-containing protein n=1 Tax=Penstemon smallii TaxID=265156 RepID=A0ABD3SHC6_9LAMI